MSLECKVRRSGSVRASDRTGRHPGSTAENAAAGRGNPGGRRGGDGGNKISHCRSGPLIFRHIRDMFAFGEAHVCQRVKRDLMHRQKRPRI